MVHESLQRCEKYQDAKFQFLVLGRLSQHKIAKHIEEKSIIQTQLIIKEERA